MQFPAVRPGFWLTLALGVALFGLVAGIRISGFLPDDAFLTESRPPVEYADDIERPRSNRPYAQRAYPLKIIPSAARLRALEQLEREEAKLRKLNLSSVRALVSQTDQLAWIPLGPAPIGQGQTFGTPRVAVSGRVSTIVFDPGYNGNQTLYLGAAQGGIWRSKDNGATWTPITDGQPSLAMGAIAVDPTNPNIIYGGTGEAHLGGDSYYGAGLLKSTDGGATWMRVSGPVSTSDPREPAFINAAFHALVIDPTAPLTLLAATEMGSLDSSTGATSFAPLGDRGVWKSTDGGLTWLNVNPPNRAKLDVAGTDVLIDPRDPRRVFAAMSGLGIYASGAGGEPGTWTKLASGLPDADLDRIKLAAGPPLEPSQYSTLYAAISRLSNTRLLGVFKSTDGGATWASVTTPSPTSGGGFYALALAVDPVDSNTVYYGTTVNSTNTGGTLWRSRDGGQTWTDIGMGDGISGGLHVDTHWIAVDPANRNTLFTANDGGVWRTGNATAERVSWTSLNQSLNLTQFYTIALHPAESKILLGGTQDNGTVRYDGTANWLLSRGGDGGSALIDQSNPQVMYHTFQNFNNLTSTRAQIGPEISFDGGSTWTRRGCFGCEAIPGGFNPADRLSDYAPMAQHTGFVGPSGNVVYFGTHHLYRSADQGVTWTGLGASLDGFGADLTKNIPEPESTAGFPSYISVIAAHPALDHNTSPAGEVVWAGTGDGLVQVTRNAGALTTATFVDVTRPPLPNRYITDIALAPNDQRTAIVAYSGFNANTPATPGHVFLTTDQGASWKNISGNLPDIPANSVALDPLLPGTIYLGTDLGVHQTNDGGATWIRLGNGMPRVAVLMLRYHAATRSLIAATHGRGVFRLPLPITNQAVFAHMVVGQGFTTTFTVMNTGGMPLEGSLVLTGQDGNPLDAAPAVSINASAVPVMIPPGGTLFVPTAAQGVDDRLRVGWARLELAGGVTAGVATFLYAPGGVLAGLAGVLASNPVENATIPVDDDVGAQRFTGYAVANPSAEALTIKLVTVAENGTAAATLQPITLGPGQQKAQFVFQDPAASQKFRGSVVLMGQNGKRFCAVALIQNQGQYTAIPVIPSKSPGIQ